MPGTTHGRVNQMPSLKVKATLDRTEYEKGLDAMKSASKGLNSSLQGLGGIGGMIAGVFGGNILSALVSKTFGMITSSISAAREELSRLGRESENIGINPEMLGEVTRTFGRLGQGGEVVVTMFGRLAAARDKALGGNEKMVNAFKELGLSMDQVAKMPMEELFRKMAGAFALSTGSTRAAAGEIFGRGVRAPGASRALTAYGLGEISFPTSAPTNEEAVRAELEKRAFSKSLKSAGNNILRFFNAIKVNQMNTWGVGVQDKDVEAEMQKRREEEDRLRKDNAEALKRQKDKEAAKAKALDDESARYDKDKAAERKEELERGLHVQRPEMDAYRRRGLVAGGSPGNDQAYINGRRQVQIQTQMAETLRRIEANTAMEKRHKDALTKITNQYAAGDFPPEVE